MNQKNDESLSGDLGERMAVWLSRHGSEFGDLRALSEGLFEGLRSSGLPVHRLNLGIFLMHPELAGLAYQMSAGDEQVTEVTITHESIRTDVYRKSPIHTVVTEQEPMCIRLDEQGASQYDFLMELQAQGFSGYGVFPLLGTHGRVHVLSLATRHPGGWTPQQFEALERLCRPLAWLVDSLTTHHLAALLLRLYVGSKSGGRVLSGEVMLGQGRPIRAATLYSDMRDFSQFCANRGAVRTIERLNKYLAIVSGAVQEHGGEILKFVGDGVLAIFAYEQTQGAPEETDAARDAAERCLRAARLAQASLAAHECDVDGAIKAGFGLCLGEVFYGNIGAPGRLDFTVIGEAVNLAARLETFSKRVKSDIIVGPAFAKVCAQAVTSLGEQPIKGSRRPVEVFGVPLAAGAER